jgi:ATP-dependent exoDNAse (exonuclease V) beta subunit
MDTILELAKFNHIKYYDEPHKYYIDGKPTISCTGFLGKFKKPFEDNVDKPDKWALRQGYEYKAKSMADKYAHKQNFYPMEGDKYGRPDYSNPKPESEWVTEEEVKRDWKYKNNHATFEGSTLHDYIENYMSNRVFPYPEKSPEGLQFTEIEETFNVMKQYALNFYNDSVASGKLIPVKSELVVGDSELNLTGMIDQLFWNVKHECLQIWDWKTNTKLNMKNDFGNKLNHILYMLDDCEYETYSLQLNIYKKIVERNTNLKLGDSYLVWFNEENPNYEIIKCNDYGNIVDEMFKFKLENPEMFV